MIKIKSDDLWEELNRLSNQSKKSKKAAIAYVSDDSFISFSKGDILIVDASDASIAGGRTSAHVLESAYKNGTKLYSCDTLHGKTIVFDNYAYIGSANISKNSMNRLDEIGVISDHPTIIAGTIQFIEELLKRSVIIDSKFIEAILKIEVKHNTFPNSTKARKVKIGKHRTWLVSLRNDADYPGDENKVEEDNKLLETADNEEPDWFWMKKGNRFFDEAKPGDSVVIIERDKKDRNKPQSAYRHFAIKKITSDKIANTKAYHYAYTGDHVIKWSKFEKLAQKAGILRLGSGLNTVRELSAKQSNVLFEIWDS